MSININSEVKKEIEELVTFVQNHKEETIHNEQESILTTIYLLTNSKFRNAINDLREKYKIPSKWQEENGDFGDEYMEWVERKKPTPPNMPNDEEVVLVCKELKINPKRYGNFVIDYLYFGNISPKTTPSFDSFLAKDEYRYKAKIEVDYGEGLYDARFDIPTNTAQKAYIRFFKDTTANMLIEFIKANQRVIFQIQKDLEFYPHPKKWGRFKRDVQIFLLYLLGYEISEITNLIYKDNAPQTDLEKGNEFEKLYALTEDAVRILAEDFQKKFILFQQHLQDNKTP